MTTAVQNSVASSVTDRRDTATRKATPGKLLAITASGPIYASPATYTMIPLSSAMALYGELAAKVVDPRAKVVSSLAARVEGKTAYKAWAQQTSAFASSITRLSPTQRVAVLQEVLHYVRHRGVDGNETVLAAAINGAWPYLRPAILEWTLHYAKSAIARSTFTDKVPVAVVDPTTRAVAILKPGELKNQDPLEWLAFHRLKIDEWRLWFPNPGVDVPGLDSVENAEGRFKDAGLGGPDPFNDPSLNGLYGDLPGRGPKEQGNGTNGFDFGIGGGPLDDPSLNGLYGDLPGRGPKGNGTGTNGFDFGIGGGPLDDPSLTGLYGDLPGGARGGRSSGGGLLDRLGANGIGSPGGPLGFGSSLGPNGAASPDRDRDKRDATAIIGVGIAEIGLGGMVASASAMGAGGVIVGGLALAGFGAGVVIGAVIVAAVIANEMDKDNTSTRPADGQKQDQKPADGQKPAGGDQPKQPDSTPKPKEDPTQPVAEKDKYPDPSGKGKSLPSGDGEGGGDPTTIWDGDGGVGPTTIWEGDGGVGPASIWDDNGGGGNPTTVGVRVTGTTAVGPGLRAAVMQVGPNLFVY